MKKILSIIICVWLISFTLVACCGSSNAEAKVEENYRLSFIKDFSFFANGSYIIVDDETGVCYLYVDGDYSSCITVMVDENGKPLTWSGG